MISKKKAEEEKINDESIIEAIDVEDVEEEQAEDGEVVQEDTPEKKKADKSVKGNSKGTENGEKSHPESEIKENKEFKEQFKTLEEQALRIRAEFANYKRRVEREQEEFSSYLKIEIFKQLLPVLDDFKVMFDNSSTNEHQEGIVEGAKLIYEKFIQILEKEGLEKIDSLGEKFDPQIHEGMMMKPIESEEENDTILEVFQDGFKLKDKLLRPSKVVVGKLKEA